METAVSLGHVARVLNIRREFLKIIANVERKGNRLTDESYNIVVTIGRE